MAFSLVAGFAEYFSGKAGAGDRPIRTSHRGALHPRHGDEGHQVGNTVEVSGVSVRLDDVTITPAEVTALIRVNRSPEQRLAGLRRRRVALVVPSEWPSDRPTP